MFDISSLPLEEQAIVRAELRKTWEQMDPDRCKTDEGWCIVEYERRQQFHLANN